jgi:hypothetical protein
LIEDWKMETDNTKSADKKHNATKIALIACVIALIASFICMAL